MSLFHQSVKNIVRMYRKMKYAEEFSYPKTSSVHVKFTPNLRPVQFSSSKENIISFSIMILCLSHLFDDKESVDGAASYPFDQISNLSSKSSQYVVMSHKRIINCVVQKPCSNYCRIRTNKRKHHCCFHTMFQVRITTCTQLQKNKKRQRKEIS